MKQTPDVLIPSPPRHYAPKKPCKNGHLIRYVSSRTCVTCAKERYQNSKVKP